MILFQRPRLAVRIYGRHICFVLLTTIALCATCLANKPIAKKTVTEATAAPGAGFVYLGTIRPRHAREIESSNWSIGAETMDRDYTIYRNWRNYLGPLGAKKARIQSGWAKTEKEPLVSQSSDTSAEAM